MPKFSQCLQFYYKYILICVPLIVFFSMVLFPYFAYFYVNFLDHKPDGRIIDFHNVSLIILTLILVCVAWIQLAGISRVSRSDFLLRVDDRYGSKSIIQARKIIHELDCRTNTNDICSEVRIKNISDEISKICEDEKSSRQFIYLLNFLDFLETVAYFTNKELISETELKELFSDSLVYYYQILKGLINHQRSKRKNDNCYCELETLCKKFNKNFLLS